MVSTSLLLVLSAIPVAVSTWVIYNLYLHPLAKYPGPWRWRAFRFSMLQTMLGGRLPHRLRELHLQYGPIVRVAPDELSFCMPQAWHEIYHRRDFHRPPQWRGKPPGLDADSLIQADAPTHARLRKAFAPAFSDRATRGYESSINSHIDHLIQRLRAQMSTVGRGDDVQSAIVDLSKWMNFCLFDTTMDIGWGSSFTLLAEGSYHPWVIATQGLKELLIGTCLAYYQPLGTLASRNIPKEAKDSINMVLGIARRSVQQRLDMETDRQDIFANTLGRKQDLAGAGLTQEEMVANSMNYIIAGSESVTTVLTGALHYLLQNPSSLQILSQEIRAAFRKSQEITGQACQQLTYLDAVLKEAMRLVPTIPDAMRREVPVDGVTICGQPLPKHTVVSVPTWAIFTSPDYWHAPEKFAPERWLQTAVVDGGLSMQDFAQDDKSVFQPFAYGPRNCIGQNLGWEEMRLLLTRLIYEFDLTVPAGSIIEPWESQDVYWFWIKNPLKVELVPASPGA